MKCAQCGKDLVWEEADSRQPSISGSIMGDEYTESYFLCQACGVYTVEIYHDRFLGEAEVSARGPLSKVEGEAMIEIIQRCSEPWDKKCRCPAHRSYFGESLD